ncbi:P-loop containing nucleoside triphosphate hydrolase protein, partial [Blastocladiella britannica]
MAPGNAPPGSAHEGKIRVYVRSRPVNAREEQSNTPTVLKFDAIKARELGLVAGNNINRRYTFDAVFSPQATQAMVYREVVDPILSEVLKGYNCTIFAYGQTGTGKTHTMEGNTTLNPGSGDLPVDAGMIPRSLHALFRSLDALDGDSDYTVKLSALELYNEELRDLFAIGEAPMAVKLFNDVNKQVIVQNAEELNVANAAEAMVKVQEAQAKRRVAATALNERSSRSHCIFTITVHIKECPEPGAELVKTGKLNLVDLAGSENVMRSGAEYGAAREAGMINKSLLYLARVINALVKRESHIPYRESKLTRLLQESLGGRAKTAIIATVSPVSSNVEDTISTLDYAHRAMAIQNKPVANQRLKKTELLADYGLEITRLKAEL